MGSASVVDDGVARVVRGVLGCFLNLVDAVMEELAAECRLYSR